MRHNYGKIALSREIRGHWVYDDPVILKVWVSVLLMANFKDGTLILGKSKYIIKRGQTAMSMRSWSHELKLGVKKLETVFNHFEDDGMIKRVVIGKGKQSTTLITVVKYNDFQIPTESQAKHYGITIESDGNQKGSVNESQGAYNRIKYNKDNKDNKEGVYRKFAHLSISIEDANKLLENYKATTLDNVLDKIENFSGNKKYKSLYLTANNWLKKDFGDGDKFDSREIIFSNPVL